MLFNWSGIQLCHCQWRVARAEHILEETDLHIVKALNYPVPVQVQESLRANQQGEPFTHIALLMAGFLIPLHRNQYQASSEWVGVADKWIQTIAVEIFYSAAVCKWSPPHTHTHIHKYTHTHTNTNVCLSRNMYTLFCAIHLGSVLPVEVAWTRMVLWPCHSLSTLWSGWNPVSTTSISSHQSNKNVTLKLAGFSYSFTEYH